MTGGGISKNDPIWHEVESLLGVGEYAGGHFKGNEELINFGVFVLHRDRAERGGEKCKECKKQTPRYCGACVDDIALAAHHKGMGDTISAAVKAAAPDDLGEMLERLAEYTPDLTYQGNRWYIFLYGDFAKQLYGATPREAVEAAIKAVEGE